MTSELIQLKLSLPRDVVAAFRHAAVISGRSARESYEFLLTDVARSTSPSTLTHYLEPKSKYSITIFPFDVPPVTVKAGE